MSMAIHNRIDGVDDLVRAFARFSDDMARATVTATRAGVKAGEREAVTTHTFKNRTGELERGIDGRVTSATPGAATGEIVSTAAHSSYVEEGTRGHWIRPKAKAGLVGPLHESQSRRTRGTGPPRVFLRFEGKSGEMVFRRVVWHPGTEAQPFMGRAYFKCERVMLMQLERAAAKAQIYFD